MKRLSQSTAYYLRVVLASFLICQGVALCQEKTVEPSSSASDQAVQIHSKLIGDELAKGTSDEWSGEYYYGDGLGVNVTLVMGPTTGFVYRWDGCLGNYDQNYGEF